VDGTGVVLQIGSGQQQYREYLLRGASAAQRVWLLDAVPATWQQPYLAGSTVVAPLDAAGMVPDEEGLERAAREVMQHHPVLGVFTYDEALVNATARLADRLGLHGFGAQGADCCRNKHKTRQALTAAGLPQPRFAIAYTSSEAAAAAATIGYPVVVKPRGLGASMGVIRAAGPDDIADAFAVAHHAGAQGPPEYGGGVLVEELVVGPEISVDGALVAGKYRPFCLARKSVGLAPYFEEVGHVVDGADPLLYDPQLVDILVRAHRVLGLRDGMTHTEIRFGPRGPVIIEVNARLGGDLIPYLGLLATGIDPGRVAVQVATGEPPVLERARRGCAGIRFSYPPEDCRIVKVMMPAAGAVDGLVAARAIVEPGSTLRLPPHTHIGRYAYVICVSDDARTCAARLDEAAALIDLEYEALELVTAEGKAE
jgi:biotin carboxylase